MGGLWFALRGSGVIAVGKWFEWKRSGFFHNFVLWVEFQSCPVKLVEGVEVGRLEVSCEVNVNRLCVLSKFLVGNRVSLLLGKD